MSATPRTDAQTLWALDGRKNTEFIAADFARLLETELAAEKAYADSCAQNAFEQMNSRHAADNRAKELANALADLIEGASQEFNDPQRARLSDARAALAKFKGDK